jgi:hypothetical protein
MDMKSTSRVLDTDICLLLLMWEVPTKPTVEAWRGLETVLNNDLTGEVSPKCKKAT